MCHGDPENTLEKFPTVLGAGVVLSGDQLKSALRGKLRDALKRRKPASDVSVWQERKADRLGVSETTFQNWYYGNETGPSGNAPAPLPSFENWAALCREFPGLHDEVLGDIVGEPDRGPDAARRLTLVASELDELARFARGEGELPEPGPAVSEIERRRRA